MTKEQFAKMLDGREYGSEISDAEVALSANHGLVVMFGYSDDNAKFRGAVEEGLDEIPAYEGTQVRLVARSGKACVIANPTDSDCLDTEEVLKQWGYLEHAKNRFSKAATIHFNWVDGVYGWIVETQVPYAPFDILEDGKKFCRGIVVAVSDLPAWETI